MYDKKWMCFARKRKKLLVKLTIGLWKMVILIIEFGYINIFSSFLHHDILLMHQPSTRFIIRFQKSEVPKLSTVSKMKLININ